MAMKGSAMINIFESMETDTVASAKALLGMTLQLNGQVIGRIVETEAYLFPDDAASHSFKGRRTQRNEAMYLSAGHWYVYQLYGHQMLNFVTAAKGVAEAVLIRALELANGELLANGPGKLTAYAGIDKRFDKTGLSALTVAPDVLPKQIAQRPRIGIHCPEPWQSAPLGFYVAGNAAVSKIRKSEIRTEPWKS
jgi:DNA-3-methyladenine glycosylase